MSKNSQTDIRLEANNIMCYKVLLYSSIYANNFDTDNNQVTIYEMFKRVVVLVFQREVKHMCTQTQIRVIFSDFTVCFTRICGRKPS